MASDSEQHHNSDTTRQAGQQDQQDSTSTLQHNQSIHQLTVGIQESFRFLRYMALVLNHWYESAQDYPDEGTSVYQPLIKSGEIPEGLVDHHTPRQHIHNPATTPRACVHSAQDLMCRLLQTS